MHVARAIVAWMASHYWEVLLAMLVAGFLVVVWRLHQSTDTAFRFEQFFTNERGEADLKRLFGFGAFGVHSWITARYAAVTDLNDYALSLVASYAILWAGVLMLGKGVERLLDAAAGVIARKFGLGFETPKGDADGRCNEAGNR